MIHASKLNKLPKLFAFFFITLVSSMLISHADALSQDWHGMTMPKIVNFDTNPDGSIKTDGTDEQENFNRSIVHVYYLAPTGGYGPLVSCNLHPFNNSIIVCYLKLSYPTPGSMVTQAFVNHDVKSAPILNIRPSQVEKILFIYENGWTYEMPQSNGSSVAGFTTEEIIPPCEI